VGTELNAALPSEAKGSGGYGGQRMSDTAAWRCKLKPEKLVLKAPGF